MGQMNMMRPGMRPGAPRPGMPPARKMMADGGGIGMPAAIGGSPEPPAAPGADPDQDGDVDVPVIKPEAVNYHDDAQNCSGCQYFGTDGQCEVLKMEVHPDGGCSAFTAKAGGDEGADDDQMTMDDDQDMQGGQ